MPIKTPEVNNLIVPSKKLANAIAGEWRAHKVISNIQNMPLTRFCFTVIDKIQTNRSKINKQILEWINFELLCYRASNPKDLIELQNDRWERHLNWLALIHNVKLISTSSLNQNIQSKRSLIELKKIIVQFDDFSLVALMELYSIYGSLVLGLRVLSGSLNWDIAFEDSLLETTWQNLSWGSDPELKTQKDSLYKEMIIVKTYMNLLKK